MIHRVLMISAFLLLAQILALAVSERYSSVTIDNEGLLHITTRDGREIILTKEPDQVSFSQPDISIDGVAVGWLAEFPNCCTSYPIPLKLFLYVDGRTQTFTGCGLPVWKWEFQAGGKRIAFMQETVHGGEGIHYELRDVATGNLIAEYEPKDNQPPPKWVRRLDNKKN